ncbi:hypothetical protein NPIL_446471 [Nephila pilipes]|uniref:Uncharacterized protein n=1 Tax=Nephila pilipes TaxID=299642 RepID=A0A8X6IS44_NEPPI|nr:hypothetical protein NPIL_446471 [Nephila pilipes]
MAKSEASAQRDNGNPDFGKDYKAALVKSDLPCSKCFIVPSVHGTFLQSFFVSPFSRSSRGNGQEPSAVIRYPKYSTWSAPITDLATLTLRPY